MYQTDHFRGRTTTVAQELSISHPLRWDYLRKTKETLPSQHLKAAEASTHVGGHGYFFPEWSILSDPGILY